MMLLALLFTGIGCFILGRHYSKTEYRDHYHMRYHFDLHFATIENRRIIKVLEDDKRRLQRDMRLMKGLRP